MAVRLFLSSGTQRAIDAADSAHLDDAFFKVTKRDPGTGRVDTLLTLRSTEVFVAEVLRDGVVTDLILGRGQAST